MLATLSTFILNKTLIGNKETHQNEKYTNLFDPISRKEFEFAMRDIIDPYRNLDEIVKLKCEHNKYKILDVSDENTDVIDQ